MNGLRWQHSSEFASLTCRAIRIPYAEIDVLTGPFCLRPLSHLIDCYRILFASSFVLAKCPH